MVESVYLYMVKSQFLILAFHIKIACWKIQSEDLLPGLIKQNNIAILASHLFSIQS